jgi:hypothetical protein
MSYAHDGATRKNISRVWCLTEGCYWVWCYEGGNELTYRQVSQVTDTPDEVKTFPTHYKSLHFFVSFILPGFLSPEVE